MECDGRLLSEDYIDYLIFGEGEIPFRDLLVALYDGDVSSVKNIAYRQDGKTVLSEREYYTDDPDYPSPYLSGMFDSLFDAYPDVCFLAVLETNRGCPYGCSYCDWTSRKMRFFPMEKVQKEIEWMSRNKIEYCFCADSNFGMFERDKEIAQLLIKAKKNTGYPKVFRPCYEKNSDDNVFEICKNLNEYGMDKGATMAYQTLSDEALRNVNRKNLTLEHFSNLVTRYKKAGVPTYSELILGLPGETYESFCNGLCRLLESGQHNSVSVYYCEFLPNTVLSSPEYVKKHGIKYEKVAFNHIHSAAVEEEIPEYSYIVMETATMSREMWVKSNIFSICLQCFHSLGLLRCFAVYLNYVKGVKYEVFYKGLVDYIFSSEDTLLYRLFNGFREKLASSLKGDWNYQSPLFGDVVWFFEEGAFLELLYNSDTFEKEIMPYLSRFTDDDVLLSELWRYQTAVIRKPFSKCEEIVFSYDFYSFFESLYSGEDAQLKKEKILFTVNDTDVYTDWKKYAKEVVWFGRRRGATVITNNKNLFEIKNLG